MANAQNIGLRIKKQYPQKLLHKKDMNMFNKYSS